MPSRHDLKRLPGSAPQAKERQLRADLAAFLSELPVTIALTASDAASSVS